VNTPEPVSCELIGKKGEGQVVGEAGGGVRAAQYGVPGQRHHEGGQPGTGEHSAIALFGD
jgi:hypothetical protein